MKLFTYNKENSINVNNTDIINYGLNEFPKYLRRPNKHYAFDDELYNSFNNLNNTNSILYVEGEIEGIDFNIPVIFKLFIETHRNRKVIKFSTFFFDEDFNYIINKIPQFINSKHFDQQRYHEYLEKQKRDEGKSMIQILKELPESDIDEWIKKIEKKEEIKSKRLNTIHNFINSLSETELNNIFKRILEFNNKYENYKYDEYHCMTCSNIYYYVIEYLKEYGKDATDEYDEDFLSSAYILNKYLVKTYHGQGSFSTIEKIS